MRLQHEIEEVSEEINEMNDKQTYLQQIKQNNLTEDNIKKEISEKTQKLQKIKGACRELKNSTQNINVAMSLLN